MPFDRFRAEGSKASGNALIGAAHAFFEKRALHRRP
jgi:hypothetical protein